MSKEGEGGWRVSEESKGGWRVSEECEGGWRVSEEDEGGWCVCVCVCMCVCEVKWMLVELCMLYRTTLQPLPMTGTNQDGQYDENQRGTPV